MRLENLRLDVERIEAGEWVENIPGLGDIRLKVRGSNCAAFRLAQAKAQRGITSADRHEGGLVDPKAVDVVLGTALAEAVLVDWENVEIDGQMARYSKPLAHTLLVDPEMALFRDGVAWASDYVSTMRKETEDPALGK